jgi:hypothetical protein
MIPCKEQKCLKFPMCLAKKFIVCTELYKYYKEMYQVIKYDVGDIANHHSKIKAMLWTNIKEEFPNTEEVFPDQGDLRHDSVHRI